MKLFFTPKKHYLNLTSKLINKVDKECRIYELEKKVFDDLRITLKSWWIK